MAPQEASRRGSGRYCLHQQYEGLADAVDLPAGMRAAFTEAPHMRPFVIYPVVVAFAAVFLTIGLRNFRRRVLS